MEHDDTAAETATGNGAHPDHGSANLDVIDAKLNIVISKVALLERDDETVFDRLDELRKGQVEIINGQKAILNTLTNEVLSMNQTLKAHVRSHPSKSTRYVLAFTGGIAGGVAGGAVMTLLLKLGAALENPSAQALLSWLQR